MPRAGWRRRQAVNRTLYCICQTWAGVAMTALTAVRYFNVPTLESGQGVLMASNHQSFLDPMLVGIAFDRPVHFLARESLFRVPLFGRLISGVGAHPVRRGQTDISALKTAIRILRGGRALLMFPEGTRTPDGELGEFKAGVGSLAVRCGVPLLPVCIEGAYQCWPRTQRLPRSPLPRPGPVAVAFGELLRPEGAKGADLAAVLWDRVASLQVGLRQYLRRDA